MDASYIDLADPSHLEFDYMRWIRIVLTAARARRVLHLGGGACALPRALAARDPGGLQQVCEVDGDVLAMARAHFGLRRAPGLRVRNVDGLEFLARQPDASFDAVVIDAFVGASVPPRLISGAATENTFRVAPLALINVLDDRSARLIRSVATTLATRYANVWAIHGRGGNTVLLAGSLAQSALERVAAQLARDASPARLTAFTGSGASRA
jgi:hypothetical protein